MHIQKYLSNSWFKLRSLTGQIANDTLGYWDGTKGGRSNFRGGQGHPGPPFWICP